MVRHYGCKVSNCRVLRAYIRLDRTKWTPIGYYHTGCDKFDSDVAIEKRRKDPEEQKKVAMILARLRGR